MSRELFLRLLGRHQVLLASSADSALGAIVDQLTFTNRPPLSLGVGIAADRVDFIVLASLLFLSPSYVFLTIALSLWQ